MTWTILLKFGCSTKEEFFEPRRQKGAHAAALRMQSQEPRSRSSGMHPFNRNFSTHGNFERSKYGDS